MNAPVVIAPVRKSVRVKAPVARAFDVFTSGLSRWWPLDHGVGKKTDREGPDGAAAGRTLAGNIGRRHTDQRCHDHLVGAAASPGDGLADQRPMEARKDFLPAIALKSPLSGRAMGVFQIAR